MFVISLEGKKGSRCVNASVKPVGIILSCPVSLAYRFVVIVADIVGVGDKEEAISPFLVLFQALED